MKRIIHIFLLTITILSLSACNLGGGNTDENANVAAVSGLQLTIQVLNPGDTFTTIGQTINFMFVVKNNGTDSLPGPVMINNDKMVVTCPNLTTVGNLNAALESGETISCPGSYPITQNDLNAGSVTVTATASAGGVISSPATVTIQMSANRVLTLTITPNPTTYSQVGQTISYTFVIKNSGAQVLSGPFTITDTKMTVACIPTASGQLASNEQMTCTGTYQISQADASAPSMTNSSTASGGGATSGPVNTTITNTAIATVTSTPGNYVAGSTISHTVKTGEWLLQIARCYGADYSKVRQANPAITNPAYIKPGLIVSVPNIGSAGPVYGPPCVVFHTVVSGETWESIAALYNADVAILKEANHVTFAAGVVLKVPKNSAGKNTPLPMPTATITPVPSLTPLPTLTPIPLPTLTPGAVPTMTPPPLPTIAYFTVNSNSVKVGSTIILSWSFSGQDLTQSRLTRSNPDGSQTPLYGGGDVPLTGTYEDLAATTGSFIYTLSVSSEFGGTTVKTVGVLVNP